MSYLWTDFPYMIPLAIRIIVAVRVKLVCICRGPKEVRRRRGAPRDRPLQDCLGHLQTTLSHNLIMYKYVGYPHRRICSKIFLIRHPALQARDERTYGGHGYAIYYPPSFSSLADLRLLNYVHETIRLLFETRNGPSVPFLSLLIRKCSE